MSEHDGVASAIALSVDVDARYDRETLYRIAEELGLGADTHNSNIIVEVQALKAPVPMRLHCPECGELHIDEGDFAKKRHHTHACQHCGAVWRPAIVATVGVRFLPGFKNEG